MTSFFTKVILSCFTSAVKVKTQTELPLGMKTYIVYVENYGQK